MMATERLTAGIRPALFRRAGLLALGAAWSAAAATGAAAEVVLDTSVSKVETTLDAGGRVKRELLPADDVVPGEELRYTITFSNESTVPVDAQRIVITNPVPEGTRYVPGTAGGEGSRVEFSRDGETFDVSEPEAPAGAGGQPAEPPPVHSLRWTFQRELAPGDSGEVHFHVRML